MTENNDKKIEVEQANKMTFITHGFRVSVVSDVRERVRDLVSPLRFMLRRSSLQGGQRTSYIRVFFIENFIMAEIFQPSDKIKLIFILF